MSLEEMWREMHCLLNGAFKVLPEERLDNADTLWPVSAHSITAVSSALMGDCADYFKIRGFLFFLKHKAYIGLVEFLFATHNFTVDCCHSKWLQNLGIAKKDQTAMLAVRRCVQTKTGPPQHAQIVLICDQDKPSHGISWKCYYCYCSWKWMKCSFPSSLFILNDIIIPNYKKVVSLNHGAYLWLFHWVVSGFREGEQFI